MSVDPTSIVIPADLLPRDGRFGCGPSKVRAEQVLALAQANQQLLGTSHWQAPVNVLITSVRAVLKKPLTLRAGWKMLTAKVRS